jgi:hypothetical protein
MSFEDIMNKFDNSAHFVVIDREFYLIDETKHFEIGFRTMSAIDYFLWIWIEDKKCRRLLKNTI